MADAERSSAWQGRACLDQRRVDQRSDDERKADTEAGTRSLTVARHERQQHGAKPLASRRKATTSRKRASSRSALPRRPQATRTKNSNRAGLTDRAHKMGDAPALDPSKSGHHVPLRELGRLKAKSITRVTGIENQMIHGNAPFLSVPRPSRGTLQKMQTTKTGNHNQTSAAAAAGRAARSTARTLGRAAGDTQSNIRHRERQQQ